jgi:hypothetical protein
MPIISRILVILVALLFLGLGLNVWFNFDAGVGGFMIAVDQPLGRAAMRADFGGFFFSIATLSGLAAWHKSPWWASAAAILIAFALSGRALTILLEGLAPGALTPMAVEGACVAALILARRVWMRG